MNTTEPTIPFPVGARVEKYTGDYQLEGEVRAVFTTRAGKTRYVVEHDPGFLHIYNGGQLRLVLPPPTTVPHASPLRCGYPDCPFCKQQTAPDITWPCAYCGSDDHKSGECPIWAEWSAFKLNQP